VIPQKLYIYCGITMDEVKEFLRDRDIYIYDSTLMIIDVTRDALMYPDFF